MITPNIGAAQEGVENLTTDKNGVNHDQEEHAQPRTEPFSQQIPLSDDSEHLTEQLDPNYVSEASASVTQSVVAGEHLTPRAINGRFNPKRPSTCPWRGPEQTLAISN